MPPNYLAGCKYGTSISRERNHPLTIARNKFVHYQNQ